MKNSKIGKFSPVEILAKRRLKKLRLDLGINRTGASKALGLTVKNIEDIEAERQYGCHLTVDVLVSFSRFYGVSVNDLFA